MNIADLKQEDTENSFTGPGPETSKEYFWGEIERQATAQDPKARGLLEIKKSTKEELILLNIEREKAKSEFENYRKSLRRTDRMLMGITILFAVSFVVAFYLIVFDSIKEKDLYLQNNNLYQNYSSRNSELRDKINEQQIEINNLENEIEVLENYKMLNLEDENNKLLEVMDCLKAKKYWQYEECFK